VHVLVKTKAIIYPIIFSILDLNILAYNAIVDCYIKSHFQDISSPEEVYSLDPENGGSNFILMVITISTRHSIITRKT
jgi:hypothetical protein